MAERLYADAVERGVGHLDINYENWWNVVDVSKLNMYSPLNHVLAQVRHELYYETPEFSMRTRGWQEVHGFELSGSSADWIELNTTWALRINELRFERDISDATPPKPRKTRR